MLVKQKIKGTKANLIILQETKMDEHRNKVMIDWATTMGMDIDLVPAVGSAGGLAILWKRSVYQSIQVWKNQRFILMLFSILPGDDTFTVGNFYGPHDDTQRESFFREISQHLENIPGRLLLGGDFNTILNDGERKGSGSNVTGDPTFRSFVDDWALIDMPLLNGDFTWYSSRNGGLSSKLDRWLLNTDAVLEFDGACQSAEDWGVSDHRAISLVLGSMDFGPKPLSFYNYWLLEEGFKELVQEWWSSSVIEGWSGFSLQGKLKEIRGKIRAWQKNRGVWGSEKIKAMEDNLHVLITRMETEGVSVELRDERLQLLNNL